MKPKTKKMPIVSNNNIILVTWFTKQDGNGKVYQEGKKEIYSGLKCFCTYHPEYNRETVSSWITRRKEPFVNEFCKIEKIGIIRPE